MVLPYLRIAVSFLPMKLHSNFYTPEGICVWFYAPQAIKLQVSS